MAFVHQQSGPLLSTPNDVNLQLMVQKIVESVEQTHPSLTRTIKILNGGDVQHTEFSALQAAASYAVRLNHSNYKTNRLYVAMVAPTTVSRKRKINMNADSVPWVLALVAYDYAK